MIPDPHRRVRLSDFNTIPDMTITEEQVMAELAAVETNHKHGWTPINLTDDAYAEPPDPPAILNLLYAGRRHVLSGAPETAKTLFAYILTITAIRTDWTCAIIDFEMGPTATRRLLTELGATHDELAAIYYVAPNAPPADGLQNIINHHVQLVLIDAAIGAYDAQDLDDNKRQDAEKFAGTWITPLWQAKIATLLIDHVTKNIDGRGKFTIGSERKLGSADVHLGLEALQTISRGGKGLVKVHVHKDRPGFLTRPTACLVELDSDPETHHIDWQLKAADNTTGAFRPTHLMEKVSRLLQQTQLTRSDIHDRKLGKKIGVVAAIDCLLAENYVSEIVPGKKGTKLQSNRPYSEETEESFPIVPIVPEPGPTVPGNVPPPTGGNGNGNDPENEQLDVYDPAVQNLLDDTDIPF